jgi:hypothetical protein
MILNIQFSILQYKCNTNWQCKIGTLELLSGITIQEFANLSTRVIPRQFVLASGLGNPPAVMVRTAKTVRFGSKPLQYVERPHLGVPYLDLYLSNCWLCWVWPDQSVPISSSGFRVFLVMVSCRYPIANRKILTLVYRCPFLMYWPPLQSKPSETRSLPHSENESQRRVNDFLSCILGNLCGNWMQMFINEVWAAFKRKRECDTLPAPF